MRSRALLAVTIGAYALLQWMRWPEPLGLDQSLFALYGRWLGHGLTLYRDLWDSKPPGLFALYALADRTAGAVHSAWLLDTLTAVLSALLASRLARALAADAAYGARDAGVAAWVAGWCGLFLWSAPAFGGAYVAGQAESCMTPLLLGAALLARRPGARAAAGCGMLLGVAVTFKLVALAALPVAWLLAVRRAPRRTLWIWTGVALPLAAAAALLAAQGVLADAIQAVLVYPRAYAAEIAHRSPLWEVLQRGGMRLGRELPVLLVFAAAGIWATRRMARATFVALSIWLALAAVAVVAQLQMAGYHLLFLLPPLCVLAGLGTPAVAAALARAWRGTQRREARAGLLLAGLALLLVAGATAETRLWIRQYTPHFKHRTGSIDRETFLIRLGGPGPLWAEAEAIADSIRAVPAPAAAGTRRDATPAPSMLVWGLAPSVYVLADARPVTRYAFHQTFYVPGSPLSQRWPDPYARRMELLESVRRDPPDWVVIVHTDRSGLEPQDSATELLAFPPLALFFDDRYELRARTHAYELLRRKPLD